MDMVVNSICEVGYAHKFHNPLENMNILGESTDGAAMNPRKGRIWHSGSGIYSRCAHTNKHTHTNINAHNPSVYNVINKYNHRAFNRYYRASTNIYDDNETRRMEMGMRGWWWEEMMGSTELDMTAKYTAIIGFAEGKFAELHRAGCSCACVWRQMTSVRNAFRNS